MLMEDIDDAIERLIRILRDLCSDDGVLFFYGFVLRISQHITQRRRDSPERLVYCTTA